MSIAFSLRALALLVILAGCDGSGQPTAARDGDAPTVALTIPIIESTSIAVDSTAVTAIDAARRDSARMPADASGPSVYEQQLAEAVDTPRRAPPASVVGKPDAAMPESAAAALLDGDDAVTIGG